MLEFKDYSICFSKLNIDFERNIFSKEDIANIISSYQIDETTLEVKFVDGTNSPMFINAEATIDTKKKSIDELNCNYEINCDYEELIKFAEKYTMDIAFKNARILFAIYHELRHLKQILLLKDEKWLSMYDYLLKCSVFETILMPQKKYTSLHNKILIEFDANAFSLKIMNENLKNYVSPKVIYQFNQFTSYYLYEGYKDKLFWISKSPIKRVLDFNNVINDRKKIKLAIETCEDYGLDKGGKITYSEYKELRDIANGKVKTMDVFKHLGY